jgi:hypothetical protein
MTTPKSNIMNLSLDQINNMLIVTPARPINNDSSNQNNGFNFLDTDLLAQDFLKYAELDRNYLTEYNKLDKNFLDTDFLYNFLDMSASQLLTNELTEFNSLLPKYNAASGLKYYVENDFVTIYKETYNAYSQITTPTTQSTTIVLTQEGVEVKQIVNYAGSTTITIRQSN